MTIHHLDDISISLKGTMQIVTREAHKLTYKHIGSNQQIEQILNLIK